ncbi:MAG: hypothetical protein HZB98_14435 [Bacteroidia bacterium]|nr:hypothetical protein [Bacteroidia bacterium]
MKTIKRLLVLLLFFLNVILSLNSQSIAGTWIFDKGNFPVTMLLLENGTGEFQGMPIRYKAQNGKFTIDDGVQPVVYDFKLDRNLLTVSGGDLQAPLTFTRAGSAASDSGPSNTANQPAPVSSEQQAAIGGNNLNVTAGNSKLSGIWQGQQGKIIFYPDGLLIYNGTSYNYSSGGNSLTITGNDGTVTFNSDIAGNKLTLSQNGSSATYTKTGDITPDRVDPQLAGKWCMISSSYNSYSGGGSSSEECITLNADGTYQYFYSGSVSAYTVDKSAYGGTGSQNSDMGYWKTDGETILSVSKTSGKTTRYSLTRQNEQNGDPAIIIGGRKFVTAYRRQPW